MHNSGLGSLHSEHHRLVRVASHICHCCRWLCKMVTNFVDTLFTLPLRPLLIIISLSHFWQLKGPFYPLVLALSVGFSIPIRPRVLAHGWCHMPVMTMALAGADRRQHLSPPVQQAFCWQAPVQVYLHPGVCCSCDRPATNPSYCRSVAFMDHCVFWAALWGSSWVQDEDAWWVEINSVQGRDSTLLIAQILMWLLLS